MGRAAGALLVMGIIAKLIGALYRVPLTNIVGAEGMGLYQMVFPLYTVLLAFCGGGITNAMSRVVAKYGAMGDERSTLRLVRITLFPLIGISIGCAGGVILLSGKISLLQGNTDARFAYMALAPSLLFTGGISVLRGYFQGRAQMLPSGVSQLIEQTGKLALGLYLSKKLLKYGVKYGVCGALIGVSASELGALSYLLVRFAITNRARKSYIKLLPMTEAAAEFSALQVSDKTLLKEVYAFALSVTLGSLVLPVTQMIDSVLVINLLMYGGAGRQSATALFGLMVGPVGTLINMPTVVALSVAVALLPTLTRSATLGEDCSAPVRNAAKWIMLFVIPVTLVFLLFPGRVCGTLYRRGLTEYQLAVASRLLRLQSLSVLYIGLLQLFTAILQGKNLAHKPVINLIIGACVKVALTPLFVRLFGIYGSAAASALCFCISCVLTARCAHKVMPIGAKLSDCLIKPLIFSLAGLGLFALCTLLPLPYFWQTVLGAAAFVAAYLPGIVVSGALDLKSILSSVKARAKSRR